MVMAKDLEVRFGSGKDVLSAYWGYLSDGGLIIPDQAGLDVGQAVSLSVLIESSRASYSLTGKVVRRDSGSGQAVIAFSPGQPHDMLLTHALAEADKVPARRARRFRVDIEAWVRHSENGAEPTKARVLDLSEHGCCLRVEAESEYHVATPIEIDAPDFRVTGQVVWTRHTERGVMFGESDIEPVRGYLRKLGSP